MNHGISTALPKGNHLKRFTCDSITKWSRTLYQKDLLIICCMTSVAKIIEIVGSSNTGWQDAAQVALNEAKKTIHGITGVEVGDMTAKVDPNSGNITEYHTSVKIAFGVEHK